MGTTGRRAKPRAGSDDDAIEAQIARMEDLARAEEARTAALADEAALVRRLLELVPTATTGDVTAAIRALKWKATGRRA